MVKFFVDRLILTIFVAFGASLLVFALIHLVPGDPVKAALGIMSTPELVAEIREDLGLNQPLYVQYFTWLRKIFQGDFGISIQNRIPVNQRLAIAFPVSFELVTFGIILSVLIAVPLGVLVVVFKKLDFLFVLFSIIGISMPQFWAAILLIIFFSIQLKLLSFGAFVFLFEDPVKHLLYMIMPVIALALPMISVTMRITRTSMLEVIQKPYIRTMKAIGLGEARVIFTHAFKNALIPIVTVTGLQFGYLLGGAIIIESIFGLPGLGLLILDSAAVKDYPTIQAVTLILTLWFVLINFVTDLLYAYLDPRIKYD